MRSSVKKIIGVVFIVISILILVTPFTPGSLIFLILGAEFLGLGDKLKTWLKIRK